MKKLVLANIFLAVFLLATGPALAADNDDLDVTMQLMGAEDRNPEMITNQIELPESLQTRTRSQTRVMDGEQSGDMNQLRTQTRTQEMQQLRDTSRTSASEEMQQTMMGESRQQRLGSGGAR